MQICGQMASGNDLVAFQHVFCDGAEEGIFVRGLPEMNISDIYLEIMVLKTAKGAGLLFSINGDKCSPIRVTATDDSKAVCNAAFQYGAVGKVLQIN
jgi:hypothetical protein